MFGDLDDLIRKAEEELSAHERELSHAETEQADVAERISRIQLCQRMIRNIRMNMASPEATGLTMRVNQLRAISELIVFLQREGGEEFKGRFKQPTGAGKTVLFGIIVKLIGVKTLILVPRQNLLSNTKKEFTTMVGIPDEDIGMVGAGEVDLEKTITIATYQSHLSRMKKDAAYRKHVQECDLVILDEAHRSLGDATKDSIDSIDDENEETAPETNTRPDDEEITAEEERLEEEVFADLEHVTNKQSLKLAFTATPTLAQKDVADQFPYLISEEKQGDLVKAGILVPYRIIHVSASCETDDFEGYLSEEAEADVLRKENVYGKLAEAYAAALKKYDEKRGEADYPLHGVAFCVNIAECDTFAAEAAKNGLRARVVTGREAKGKKGDAVIASAEQALLDGEIDLIVTVNKLGEGWNFKPANAAIWARATTSPMIVIQGVGRTCRTHTDEQGRTKPHSLVFETNWSLRGSNSGRIHKKPLTIGQALALNGEDPDQVCSMDNGSKLHIEKFATLNEDGTAEVDGMEYVEAIRYLRNARPFLTVYAAATLLRYFPSVKPAQPAYPVVQRGNIVRCYLKSEIDRILQCSAYVAENGTVQLPTSGAPDQEAPTEREAVYVRKYLEEKVESPDNWLAHAKKRGLLSLDTGDIKIFHLRAKTVEVEVHAKKAVDDMLKKLVVSSLGSKQMGSGIEIEIAEGQKRTAIRVEHSPLVPAAILDQVLEEIRKRGIQPIPYEIAGARSSTEIVLYWEDEIKAIASELKTENVRRKREEEDKREERRKQDILDQAAAKRQASENRANLIKESVYREVTPLDVLGAYHIRCGYLKNQKPSKTECDVVKIDEYVSPELGRTLTVAEQAKITQGMSTLIAGDHSKYFREMKFYFKRAIDELIQKHLLQG